MRDISDLTGFPEMMDGRVKTLHPKVHGGLLAVRDNADHAAAMDEHGIGAIDLVAVNLYPFEETIAKGADYDEIIENIDIGGPAMIRSAAKNHRLCDGRRRSRRLCRGARGASAEPGGVPYALRQKLAAKAYARTAAYDAAISTWFARDARLSTTFPIAALPARCARSCAMARTRINGRRSTPTATARPGVATATQLQGKSLSYNNLNDTDAAFELISEFDPSSAGGRDHQARQSLRRRHRPTTWLTAYRKALRTDPVSAFGGIVALNREIDAATATEIVKSLHRGDRRARRRRAEAQAIIAAKKNLRLLVTGALADPQGRRADRRARWPAACWCRRATTAMSTTSSSRW